jgi:hypothetical protein
MIVSIRNSWAGLVMRGFSRCFAAQNRRTWESAGLTDFLRALAFPPRLNGVQGTVMPLTRKHPQHSSPGATIDTDAYRKASSELADCAPCVKGGDFIDQTIAIWQERTERKLTREDGREIIENITGLFTILQEWERKERTAGHTKGAASALDSRVVRQKGEPETKRNRPLFQARSKPRF